MIKSILRLAVFRISVLILPSFALAAQPFASVGWSISEARAFQTELISEFSVTTGKLQWRSVAETESIVQVVALAEAPDHVLGPIRFSEVFLKQIQDNGRHSSAAFALLSAGTWNGGCAYVDGRQIPEHGHARINLTSGDAFTLTNIGGTQLRLAATTRRLQLCLAFAVPRSLAGNWLLQVGKIELPVASAFSSANAAPAIEGAQRTEDGMAATRHPSGNGNDHTALSGWIPVALVTTLFALAFVFRRRLIQVWHRSGNGPSRATDIAHEETAIPELSEADVPTEFSLLEEQPGAGGGMLAAAARAMQAEDYASAQDFLHQSLELGLSPGHAGKARLYLAEAALGRGDLLSAINEYKQCLQGVRVALWIALPAATNLAKIYSELGMRKSAKLANRIIASAPVPGESLQPSRALLIRQLAAKLRI